MPLAIVLILSFSMNKACQEILRAIALLSHRTLSNKSLHNMQGGDDSKILWYL